MISWPQISYPIIKRVLLILWEGVHKSLGLILSYNVYIVTPKA